MCELEYTHLFEKILNIMSQQSYAVIFPNLRKNGISNFDRFFIDKMEALKYTIEKNLELIENNQILQDTDIEKLYSFILEKYGHLSGIRMIKHGATI